MSAHLGFVGLGAMGGAMVRGLGGADVTLHGTDLNTGNVRALQDECGLTPHDDARGLAEACDYVVLAVKPQHAAATLEAMAPALDADTCVLSICAGLTLATLKDHTEGRCPVVRVMPNTPAMVNAGVFAVCLDDASLSDAQKDFAATVFQPLGQVHVLPEGLFDAFTALIGSGPAYVLYFMEAMVESGVTLGLTRAQATEMTQGLFAGTVKMAQESEQHMSILREMVTSPGGTTIRALNHLDRTATRANISDAVRESWLRSIELGKK